MKSKHQPYDKPKRAALVLTIALGACAETGSGVGPQFSTDLNCSISSSEIFSGGPGKDGIPSLTNPIMAAPEAPGTEYLQPGDRVIGVVLEDVVVAVPINILWWHEIVNLNLFGERLAVSHCPLTGSSMVFDRSSIGGAELGVSGLLYRNNLIMYDRNSDESLWPQMERQARCGSRDGDALPMVPAWEMTWEGWQRLHPQTLVVTSETGFGRNYQLYPYGDYDSINNERVLFPMGQLNRDRPPKERVLGVPNGSGGWAYPFGVLRDLGPEAAVNQDGHVVFWESQRQAAMAFSRIVDGQKLEFTFGQGQIRDIQTNSVWRIDGIAVSGPLAGSQLDPIADAYVAYWFAWAAFQPDAEFGVNP